MFDLSFVVFLRARRVTKMSNRVANSILSGVLKVSGFVTSTVLNSKPAQKFFKLMLGEVILASLDGFGMALSHYQKMLNLRSCISFMQLYVSRRFETLDL